MLLVFVQQIVKDFLVEERNAFEIVTRSRLETHDLIDQAVRFMRQISDVLLPSYFLLHVCGVVSDLKLDCV